VPVPSRHTRTTPNVGAAGTQPTPGPLNLNQMSIFDHFVDF